MLVAQTIPHCVHFSSSTQQTSEIGLSLQVFYWQQQNDSEEYHKLSQLLIASSPTSPSLHEEDEVRNIVGHLRG